MSVNQTESRALQSSDGYQILFFAIAIVGAAALLLYFPEPKPLLSAPLPDNLVLINVTTINRSDKLVRLYPVSRVNVSFYSLAADGQTSKYRLQVRTDTNGLAQIKLYEGEYLVQVADWTPQKIVVAGDSILSIRRFEIEDAPKIRIIAASKDWVVSPHDLMEVTYTNQFKKPVSLQGVTFFGRAIESVGCKLALKRNASERCTITAEIQPGKGWGETFQNPSGGFIAWDSAKRSIGITLHLSYVEADVKAKPAR